MIEAASPALLEPSLFDALTAVNDSESLPEATRRHWSCSIRRIARALDRPLELLPSRWTALRMPVARLHHAQLGMQAKTLSNHRANVRAAVCWFRGETGGPPRGAPLTPEWSGLRDAITDVGLRARLYGLMRYCSAKALAPSDLSDETLASFLRYRAETTTRESGIAAHRSVARSWNRCVNEIAGWPKQALAEPALVGDTGLSWEMFPAVLRSDVDAYLEGLSRIRRTATGKRFRPAKHSTILTRRRELVAYARKAVHIGIKPEDLTCLSALVNPRTAERVIGAYWNEDGDEPRAYTIDLAWKILSIARQTGALDESGIEQLEDMRAELEHYRRGGLTDANIALIRKVLSGSTWAEVTRLPFRLMEQARELRERAPIKAALRAQLAVAIGLLTVAPVRCGNLVRTRLDHNLIRPTGPLKPFWLVFPDYDVKNRVRLEFPLDAELTRLLEEYLFEHRSALLRGSNELWLFPGKNGSFKTPSMFSTQITRAVDRATGLPIRAHQFRHAAAALILRERRGDYEFVRRVLGHKNIQTTTNFYVGLETMQANVRFAEIVRKNAGFEEARP